VREPTDLRSQRNVKDLETTDINAWFEDLGNMNDNYGFPLHIIIVHRRFS